MAQKRMFSLNVVDTDKFLEMPISSRLLYYELGMRADDDGFVSNWKKILLFTGLKEDDLKVLIAKNFIIPFSSGVIVIKHWRVNNYLKNDRVKPTIHQEELKQLCLDDNNVYNLYPEWRHSIDQIRIDQNSIDNIYSPADAEQNLLPTTTNLSATSNLIKTIVEHLNLKTGCSYKYTTSSTKSKINARLNEGFKLDDFIVVIDKKVAEWKDTDMAKYLRPETLFGTKFESYLNQKDKTNTPVWFNQQQKKNEQGLDELKEILEDLGEEENDGRKI